MLEHQSEFGIMRLGALTLFDIRGYVSMDAGPAIKDAYGVIDHERVKKILLRVDEDTFFNSEGIIAIFQILVEAKKNQQQITITGLSKHFQKIFHMSGISRLAPICKTVDEALQSLGLEKGGMEIPAFRGGAED
jgi:anti-anti-sigma factor